MRNTHIGRRVAWLVFFLLAVSPAFGISVEEAKTKGLVGERPNGYLGVVNPAAPEAQALANEVNEKRRQAYEDIAKRNRTQLDAVEALAGEKAIQNTKPGYFVEGPGGWTRK
ncbi:MAG TPA: YdbL family protein [Nitrospira sp.]|nr:YdbL family protein [Nitrospira sp.]